MKQILIGYSMYNDHLQNLISALEEKGYKTTAVDGHQEILHAVKNNASIISVILSNDIIDKDLTDKILLLNEDLPIFSLKDTDDLNEFRFCNNWAPCSVC